MVHGLVNCNIHLFNQNAVGWNSISLLDVNDVANHQVLNPNGISCSVGPAVNCHLLFIYFVFESQKLFVFTVVAN